MIKDEVEPIGGFIGDAYIQPAFLATQALAQADQLLAARGALLAEARGIVERWIKAYTGRLRWLRPEAGSPP